MTDNNQKNQEKPQEHKEVKANEEKNNDKKHEEKDISVEQKLKDTEDKLLTLAEIENQRRRFERN